MSQRIVICGSMSTYVEMIKYQKLLKNNGILSLIPEQTDFDNIPAFTSKDALNSKYNVTKEYMAEIGNDFTYGILVVNVRKNGKANYIGASVFAEIAVAVYEEKKVYLLEDYYDPYYEELITWRAVALHGNIDHLIKEIMP